MKRRILLAAVLTALSIPQLPLAAAENPLRGAVVASVDREFPSLLALYTDLHRNPELSLMEERTAGVITKELRAAGVEVTEGFGGGFGVVGVLRNGPGPTVLLRADLDGLPVLEETGLPYASTRRTKNLAGQEVPVMHACGHDVHMTCLVGAARTLVALTTTTPVAGVPPTVTDVVPPRLEPEMVIVVPPATGPAEGTIEVIAGGAT